MRNNILVLSILIGIASIATTVNAATVSTYFGQIYSGDGGSALEGYLDMPNGIVARSDGSFVITDTINNVIRRIKRDGTFATFSGSGDFGATNGAASKATWSQPEGITEHQGIFFIADTGSNSIRKIANGRVTTLPIPSLKRPTAIVTDGRTLYVSDTGNDRVVSVPVGGGKVSTVASVAEPLKLVLSGSTLYVVESGNGRILALKVKKKTKRIVADGFTEPRSLVLVDGKLIVSAGPSGIDNELWRVDPTTGETELLERRRETEWLNTTSDIAVATVNGSRRLVLLQSGGSSVFTTALDGSDLQQIAGRHRFGDETGNRRTGLMGRPSAIVVSRDAATIYVVYGQGNKIGAYDVGTGMFAPLAGHLMDNYREGTGSEARFSGIGSIALSNNGATLYIADKNNHRIRLLDTATGESSYVTGAGMTNLISPDSTTGLIDPNSRNGYQEGGPCPDELSAGAAGCAYFDRPSGIALTSDGATLYVADTVNNRIRSVATTTGETAFVAGSGEKGFSDGIGTVASFRTPTSIALSADDRTLYVVDKKNHAIRAVDLATKNVTTLAGTGKAGYREGLFAKARLSLPEYVALGSDGALYLSEAGSLRVRKLDLSTGRTSLVAGTGNRGFKNGAAELSRWNGPKGLAFLGNRLLVTDFFNDLVRSVDSVMSATRRRR